MSTDVKKSLAEVMEAMQNLSRCFEEKIDELRKKGTEEKELLQLTNGAAAMKDACGIYLAWANHYIARLNKTEGNESDEEAADLLEE